MLLYEKEEVQGVLGRVLKDYLVSHLNTFIRECKYSLISAFGEEHCGDKQFYEKVVNNNQLFSNLCQRKLLNPFKWLQFVLGITFNAISYILFTLVDLIASPLTALSALCLCIWRRSSIGEDSRETFEEAFQDSIRWMHLLLTSPGKYFIVGNVAFIRNPIETLLSPINRIVHPIRSLNYKYVLSTLTVGLGFGALGVLSFAMIGFPLFSHISVLLFFPVLINMITGFAGPLVLEVISGIICCLNMMAVMLNTFESMDEQSRLAKEREQAAMNATLPSRPVIRGSFQRVLQSVKELHQMRLPGIYFEKIDGERYHTRARRVENYLTPKSTKHYSLYKFFDIHVSASRGEHQAKQETPASDLSMVPEHT